MPISFRPTIQLDARICKLLPGYYVRKMVNPYSLPFNSSDNVEAVLEGIGGNTEPSSVPKPKPRYQISYYDTVSHSPSSSVGQGHQYNQHNQQLYSNTPSYPFASHGHGGVQPPAPPHQQQLHLDPSDASSAKQKQSQTLPSPNRQISRLVAGQLTKEEASHGHHHQQPPHLPPANTGIQSAGISSLSRGGGGGGVGSGVNNHKLVPPSLKPTIQQICPPSERAPGSTTLACMKECDIEKFAADNLNLHSKGIFRKKASVRDMLSWTAEAIGRPMLALSRDKAEKKIAIELFKLVQIYMGDRKARLGMNLNSVAIDIIVASLPQQQ